MLVLMLMMAVLVFGGIIALIANAGKGAEATAQAHKTHRETLIEEHSLDHVLTGRRSSFLGTRTTARLLVLCDGTRNYELPYKSLRAIALTPVTETISESTGE